MIFIDEAQFAKACLGLHVCVHTAKDQEGRNVGGFVHPLVIEETLKARLAVWFRDDVTVGAPPNV